MSNTDTKIKKKIFYYLFRKIFSDNYRIKIMLIQKENKVQLNNKPKL